MSFGVGSSSTATADGVLTTDNNFVTSNVDVINNNINGLLNYQFPSGVPFYGSTTTFPLFGEYAVLKYLVRANAIAQEILKLTSTATEMNQMILDYSASGEDVMKFLQSKGIDVSNFDASQFSTKGMFISNLLNIPLLMQTDSRWAGNRSLSPYGQPLGAYGCGYTSIAMILCGLKQKEISVPEVVKFFKTPIVDCNGDGRPDVALSPSGGGRDGLNQSAVTSREFQQQYGVNVREIRLRQVQQSLDMGRPCLLTTAGHYVIATPGSHTWTDNSGTTHRGILIMDPYFPNNTREWKTLPYGINNQSFGCAYSFGNS